jgi:hypothetical protein
MMFKGGMRLSMLKVTATIRRKGKVIGRAQVVGDDGDVAAIRLAGDEAKRQAKAHDAAIRARPQKFRQKRKPKTG